MKKMYFIREPSEDCHHLHTYKEGTVPLATVSPQRRYDICEAQEVLVFDDLYYQEVFDEPHSLLPPGQSSIACYMHA